MIRIFTLLLLVTLAFSAGAQTQSPVPGEEPFGKIGDDELTLKDCDFEKNANAEILFDKAVIKAYPRLLLERHIRVKIFTERGTGRANFNIIVSNDGSGNPISDLEAETCNIVNGKVEVTVMDKKSVYFTKMDRQTNKLSFALPNVRPGSVL